MAVFTNLNQKASRRFQIYLEAMAEVNGDFFE